MTQGERSLRKRLLKRPLLLGCSVLALVLLMLLVGSACHERATRMTVPKVERMLTQSGLAPGSTRAEVEGWLTTQQIYYDVTKDLFSIGGYPAQESPGEVGGPDLGQVKGLIIAKFPNAVVVPWFPWWNGEIWVYFFFDRNGRLIKYEIRAWEGYF